MKLLENLPFDLPIKGTIIKMELKSGWKGLLIFSFLALLLTASMPQMYPMFKESFESHLEGEEFVNLTLPATTPGTAILSWTAIPTATSYTVYSSDLLVMIPSETLYTGTSTQYQFTYQGNQNTYYAISAELPGQGTALIGMASTNDTKNAFDAMLDNPVYSSFTGGYDIDITDPAGFLSMYAFSWWWFVGGIYIAFLAANLMTTDFETQRLDLLFSTPLSRRQYILEKFFALALIGLFIILLSVVGLLIGIASIPDLAASLGAGEAFFSFFGAFPLLLTISATGILLGVFFKKGRIAIGANIGILVFEYLLYSFSGVAEALESLKYASIFYYWDYNKVLIEKGFNIGGFLILTVLSIILLGLAIFYFEKKDIPN